MPSRKTISAAFAILGLPSDANSERVKEAFRDLAQVWHPDRFTHSVPLSAQAEQKMKELNHAYSVVCDYLEGKSRQSASNSDQDNDGESAEDTEKNADQANPTGAKASCDEDEEVTIVTCPHCGHKGGLRLSAGRMAAPFAVRCRQCGKRFNPVPSSNSSSSEEAPSLFFKPLKIEQSPTVQQGYLDKGPSGQKKGKALLASILCLAYNANACVSVDNHINNNFDLQTFCRSSWLCARDRRRLWPFDSRSVTNSVGMSLVLIPAGEFMMGSDDSDHDAEPDEFLDAAAGKKEKHRVRITKSFYLGIHEVTRGQFRRFVDETGYLTEAENDGKGGQGLVSMNERKMTFAQHPEVHLAEYWIRADRPSPGG